jgi:hypothetical protein
MLESDYLRGPVELIKDSVNILNIQKAKCSSLFLLNVTKKARKFE